jgi:hypothetical protein
LITIISFVVLLLLIYLLLWLPPVQQKIKDVALKEIMKKTHNQMSIGKLSFRPFNHLILEEVYVGDQKGDTLLSVNELSASFDLLKLLNKQLLIRSVDLNDFVIHINKDSIDSDFNFQFFVDAFASEKQDTTSTSLLIQINDIVLKNGQLRYDILSAPALDDSDRMDYNHIQLTDFNASIDLNNLNFKQLDASLNNLSFREKSGFTLDNLQAKVRSKGSRISVEKMVLALPHSEIAVKEAWMEGKDYSVDLENNQVSPSDIQAFYPDLVALKNEVTFSGTIRGTLPQINLSQLTVDCGKHIGLRLQAFLADYTQWKTSHILLNLNQFDADSEGMRQLLNLISPERELQLPIDSGNVRLSGSIAGSLPEMKVDLNLQTGRGSLLLAGTGGYDTNVRRGHFDARVKAADLHLQTLLQNPLFRFADFQLNARGVIDSSGALTATGSAVIDSLDFNNYTYHQITADVVCEKKTIRLKLNSEDANVPLSIEGNATFDSKRSEINLTARLDSIYLDPLNLLTNYKEAYLSAVIDAKINGLDMEKANWDLHIDQFALHTDKGSFRESAFRLNYLAGEENQKQLTVSSHILNGNATGSFTYQGVKQALTEAFPVLFPVVKPLSKKNEALVENQLDFHFSINNARSFTQLLELPNEIPDSALFIGKYRETGGILKLSASAYTEFLDKDTLQLSLSLSNKTDNLALIFNVDNKSKKYDVDGSIDAEIEFIPKPESAIPDMNIKLNPTLLVINEADFTIHPAQIEVRDKRYFIHDFWVDHHETESIRLDGIISELAEDSLSLRISQFQVQTVLDAMNSNLPLSGEAGGVITMKRLLSTPVILSRNFLVKDIRFAENSVGDLNLRSIWSSERKGLALRATLAHEDHPQSTVSGYYMPEKDSISLTANIRDLELHWLKGLTEETLYGLDGSLNTDIKVSGKTTNPLINGVAYFDHAKIGVRMLNTMYSTNDTIHISSNLIELKRFTIKDKDNRTLVANGKITHRLFTDFNPNLSLIVSNFRVLDNAKKTDDLFYGNLWVNGILNIKRDNKDWTLTGNITHADNSAIMVNIPASASTAERYNSITFINSEEKESDPVEMRKKKKSSVNPAFPLKINVSFWLDPGLNAGAVFNQATGDAAQVKGAGSINFLYDLKNQSVKLLGDYEIESGKATLSLKNITQKTFTIQEGGKLTFVGDPLATLFNLTAVYHLRADLNALDPGFENMGLSSAKIPVECSLTATGSISNPELKYDLSLPDQPDETQRKVSSLLYTDELKIREIAYLLAFGTFYPMGADDGQSSSNSIWTSLASSSITHQLNNLLSGVLSENWMIGTDLHTKDESFNEMGMDVNISTRLFNNRLTVNSTLSYSNDPNQPNNFSGDFDVEYKLISSGNVVLKAYNVTNNQYFEKAKMTQGIGVVYKRNARTFTKLFDKFKKNKIKTDEK